jgi:hypothetical protein
MTETPAALKQKSAPRAFSDSVPSLVDDPTAIVFATDERPQLSRRAPEGIRRENAFQG